MQKILRTQIRFFAREAFHKRFKKYVAEDKDPFKNDSPQSEDDQLKNMKQFDQEQPFQNFNSFDQTKDDLRTKDLKDSAGTYFQNFIEETNKTGLLNRGRKMLEAIKKGDKNAFLNSTSSELNELYDRYDYYKENYISTTSNDKFRVMDESRIEGRLDQLYDQKAYINFIKNINKDKIFDAKNAQQTVSEDIKSQLNRNLIDEQKKQKQYQTPKSLNDDPDVVQAQNMEVLQNLVYAEAPEIKDMIRMQTRLSIRAKLEIFKLYCEGWTVRELSLRFGALPCRVKCIIWMIQHFFEEYLPEMSIEQIKEGLLMEDASDQASFIVDYGVDLQDLAKEEAGVIAPHFPGRFVTADMKKSFDSRKKLEGFEPEQKENHELLMRKVKKKKEDFVIEKVNSDSRDGYFLKNWIIHKGKGQMRVNYTFRKAVERSHMKEIMPLKVKLNDGIEKGPRFCGKGRDYYK